jgi:spermidine synthase
VAHSRPFDTHAAAARHDGRIEVERAGRRLDLVVDGIPYSTFHPDDPWSGYVWDPLAASILLVRAKRPKVLLLGCGAGTVLVLLRRVVPEAELLAVEIEPRVVALARERFGLDALGAELVVGDGLDFVRRTRRRFDLVIDDMFAPGKDGLARPVEDELAHLGTLARCLSPQGVAATNSTTDDDPPGLQKSLRDAYRATFAHRAVLTPRLGWNVVLVGSRARLDVPRLRARADVLPVVDRAGVRAVRAHKF